MFYYLLVPWIQSRPKTSHKCLIVLTCFCRWSFLLDPHLALRVQTRLYQMFLTLLCLEETTLKSTLQVLTCYPHYSSVCVLVVKADLSIPVSLAMTDMDVRPIAPQATIFCTVLGNSKTCKVQITVNCNVLLWWGMIISVLNFTKQLKSMLSVVVI